LSTGGVPVVLLAKLVALVLVPLTVPTLTDALPTAAFAEAIVEENVTIMFTVLVTVDIEGVVATEEPLVCVPVIFNMFFPINVEEMVGTVLE